MSLQKILVVGGNGYLGSAICKAAIARGWDVSSMSSSGTPYSTPAGHTPKWVDSVKWHKASAFDPSSFENLISDKDTAIVQTLGILLEDTGYKSAIKNNDVLGILGALGKGLRGDRNPLKSRKERMGSYEGMNRDSALTVLDTMMSRTRRSSPTSIDRAPLNAEAGPSRSFVYISAADCFRPVVPKRYIETKREAETLILQRCAEDLSANIRPIFMRPGLMYHPHIRPLSTLPAFGLSLTASLHDRLNSKLPLSLLPTSFLGGAAASLSTHPIHVDHVAEAVVRCIADPESRGVVDLDMMRTWAGFAGRKADGAPIPAA